jgi:hypothetical protein
MRGAGFRLMIAVAAMFAASAQAQNSVAASPSIYAGDTLRLWAPTAGLEGIIAAFARLDSSKLVLTGQSMNPNTPPREWGVPLIAVQRLEVLRTKPRSMKRVFTGIAIGALVGTGIGAPMGRIVECGGACDREGSLKPMVGWQLGAAIGAGVGGLLGGVIADIRRPRWDPVTLTIR